MNEMYAQLDYCLTQADVCKGKQLSCQLKARQYPADQVYWYRRAAEYGSDHDRYSRRATGIEKELELMGFVRESKNNVVEFKNGRNREHRRIPSGGHGLQRG